MTPIQRLFWPCREHGIQRLTYHAHCSGEGRLNGNTEQCTCECHSA